MTYTGAWSYAGGNGFRLYVDTTYVSGNQLYVWAHINNQYNVSGDAITLNWSGTFSGSQAFTLTASTGGDTTLYAGVIGTQGYNSTATLNFSVAGLYNGSAPTLGFSVALGPLPPAAPTAVTATRISDSQINLGWTNNPTGTAPYDNVYVSRFPNVEAASVVGALAGSTVSFSDTGLLVDREYAYQIWSHNASGNGYSAMSSFVYTTPAAPTGCTAAKTGGGDITVTWTNTSSYTAKTPVEVWHAANGTWDGAALTTISAGAAATYTHTAPNPSQTHTYKVRAKAPSALLGAYSADSNVVQLLARPNAPTGATITSTQQNGATVDAAFSSTLAWTHNPVDASAQTAYEVQYQVSTDGGATWGSMVSTGKITSGTASRVMAANTWANNRVIRWQARTWGAYAGTAPTYSDWGALTTFYTSARPVAVVTGGTTGTSSVLVGTGSYVDTEGSAQTGARWTLRTAGAVTLETVTFGPADSAKFLSYTFATVAQDATSYVVAFQVQDGPGLWSAESTKTVAITYAKPATPTLSVAYSDATGAVSGTVTNPTPGAEPAASYNVVYRDGVPLLALSNIPVNGSFTDPIPPNKADTVYTVVAVSALPSVSITSAAQHVDTSTTKVFLNGGPGMSLVVALPYAPKMKANPGRDRAWKSYKGRAEEVLYVGVQRSTIRNLTANVTPDVIVALEDLEDRAETSCYRDPRGRREFCGIADFSYTDGAGSSVLQAVALTLRRSGYSE